MARTDFILTIVNVAGESQSSQQKTDIDILSWRWAATSPRQIGADGGSHAGGKVSMDNFAFKMHTNNASPHLMYAVATNQKIPKATLECRKAGPLRREEVYLKYVLEDVYVVSYRPTGDMESATGDGNVIPVEECTLGFGKITMEYRIQNEDGSLGGTITKQWDLRSNR